MALIYGPPKKKLKENAGSEQVLLKTSTKASKLGDLNCIAEDDVFHLHLNHVLTEGDMQSTRDISFLPLNWEHLDYIGATEQVEQSPPILLKDEELGLVPIMRQSFSRALLLYRKPNTPQRTELTSLQREVLSIACSYRDLGFLKRTYESGEDIRFAYALHALNHVLKSYFTINSNNLLLKEKATTEVRDKGFFRPKVLIILPYRHSAFRVGKHLATLIKPYLQISNFGRFTEEYHQITTKGQRKSDGYYQNFEGNIDEDFKIGIRITRKAMTFYSDFYSSDIIITSMQGLNTVVKIEGERNRDIEFLSSIEILILDQFSSLLMQKIDFLDNILRCMHQLPRHNIDKSDVCRVRKWMLNGQGKYYRQTLVFSDFCHSKISRLLLVDCKNYKGALMSHSIIHHGALALVTQPVTKEFIKIDGNLKQRVEYFKNRIFPRFINKSHVLIYVNTCLEARAIMGLLHDNGLPYSGISEENGNAIEKVRAQFYKGILKITYITERIHFYRDYTVKGVRHLVFFQLPINPRLFVQACKFLSPDLSNCDTVAAEPQPSCTALVSARDVDTLKEIVGDKKRLAIFEDEDENIFKY